MPARRKPRNPDPVVAELTDIKRLLMLQLVTAGVQAKDVASALGVAKSTLSGVFPARKIRKHK